MAWVVVTAPNENLVSEAAGMAAVTSSVDSIWTDSSNSRNPAQWPHRGGESMGTVALRRRKASGNRVDSFKVGIKGMVRWDAGTSITQHLGKLQVAPTQIYLKKGRNGVGLGKRE